MIVAGKRIGEMARAFGLNPRTLRYYEGRRLLQPPRWSRGGYRLYGQEEERRLAFIAKAKSLGLMEDADDEAQSQERRR